MTPLSFKRHRDPAEGIRHAVWLHFRFNLNLRDVEEMLTARGIEVTTDGLASYGSAMRELGLTPLHRPGRLRENKRVENSHLPIRRREQQQQGFKSQASAEKFTFNLQRHLISRPTLRRFRAEADATWAAATA